MPYVGVWTSQLDEFGRYVWVNSVTGQRMYQAAGGSPLQAPMQPPIGGSPPQRGFAPAFRLGGAGGPAPPSLALPGPNWEECYDANGGKYWIHAITRMVTTRDPYM